MKETDLKYLTLKTAFLCILASGKCRGEIHVWVANKVSNVGRWEKVYTFPSSDFITKNQLVGRSTQHVSSDYYRNNPQQKNNTGYITNNI